MVKTSKISHGKNKQKLAGNSKNGLGILPSSNHWFGLLTSTILLETGPDDFVDVLREFQAEVDQSECL